MSKKIEYKITADGKGYVKTLNKMRGETQKFSGDVKSKMSSIKGALAAAFAYVSISAFKGLMDDVTKLGRLARNLEADFSSFQTITNAARQFGIEADTVADAMKDLNVKMTDGANGAKAYAEVFDMVGISLDEAISMDPVELFYRFSDAVKEAGGNMSRFSADEFGDAMFRMLPLLEKGAVAIKTMGNEYAKFSKAQLKLAESGSKEWDNMVHNLKWAVATVAGFLLPQLQKVFHTLGVIPGELASMLVFSFSAMKKIMSGDFKGAKASIDAYASHFAGAAKRMGQEYKDIWSSKPDAPDMDAPDAKPMTKEEKDKQDKQKTDLEKEANKQLEEQEKRKQALMTDEEKLLDITKQRLAAEKELGELGGKLHEDGATPAEALKLAELTTKWEELQTAEQEKQLEVQEKVNELIREQIKEKQKQDEKDIDDQVAEWERQGEEEKERRDEEDKAAKEKAEEQDDFKKEASDTREQIENERKAREEMGMSDEELLARRKTELAEKEDAFAGLGKDANKDGKIDAEDDVFRNEAELDIEERKSEIKGLELGLADKEDPQSSVIASSLASIGGGGGVAAFGNDPILSESKKQTSALLKLVSLQTAKSTEIAELNTPEL